jgi:hypothetical protein
MLALARYECRVSAPTDRPIQVAPDHYDFEKYDDRERWMSYWHQLRVVLADKPRTVLEVGPGSGVFRSYLQNVGVEVKTVDIDPSRKPDFVADITRLDETLPAGVVFDTVCAFQVLEHLPFDQFEACLAGIARRARSHVFLSLPLRGWRIRLGLWFGESFYTIGHKFRLPWTLKRCPEHYWELGKGFSPGKITTILEKYFVVKARGQIQENPYHYLWCLETKPPPG